MTLCPHLSLSLQGFRAGHCLMKERPLFFLIRLNVITTLRFQQFGEDAQCQTVQIPKTASEFVCCLLFSTAAQLSEQTRAWLCRDISQHNLNTLKQKEI